MQQWTRESPAMTFDDAYMERSKSFVKALQELKNLRPQLYSAAEYCEKSYLHNEQKQMVLDNLKDYTVRALVNAVDHLGTVAYKLTDLFEQQTVDISTMELKICCLNQRIFTCRTYMDLEGLRQQQMSTISTKHHKQYILPNSVSRKFQSNLQLQTDAQQNAIQARPRPQPPGTPAIKTLSWHIASETNTTPNGASIATSSNGDSKASKMNSEVFHLLDTEETAAPLPSSTHFRTAGGTSIPNVPPHTLGVRGSLEVSKPLSAFRSFDNPGRLDVYRLPARSKSMLSVFFAKNKTLKQKKTSAT